MTIATANDIKGLIKAGKVVALALREMMAACVPGITTHELDQIAARVFKEHGAKSAPILTYSFPGQTCISINDVAAHGIPGHTKIQPGDIVKLDVSAELDGYFADVNDTVLVPPVTPLMQNLRDAAVAGFEKGAEAAIAGNPVNAIGKAVEQEVKKRGFGILKELPGHGIGRKLHEEPSVPHYYKPRLNRKMAAGLVITIEPHISAKPTKLYQEEDGWTLTTANRSLSASFEHTVVVMPDRALIVTKFEEDF